MTSGTGSKAASIALALSIAFTLALASTSAAQAGETALDGDASDGPCVVVDPHEPGVQIDPQNCKDIVTSGSSVSPSAPVS